MERVAGFITVCEHKWLMALALSPFVGKKRCVPVNLIEEMRQVDPAKRTVELATTTSACTTRELVVLPEVIQTSSRVIARREVDISAQRRSISVTVLIGKACATTFITWILDPYTRHAIRVRRVQRHALI
jgi:hypothetical protein